MKQTKSKTCKISPPGAVPEDADHSANNAGTCQPVDPRLTQERSPHVPKGGIYFMRAGDRIKIGFSTNPLDRFKQLQTSSPVDLELLAYLPGTFDDEREMHRLFGSLHVRGEWFQNHPAILRYVKLRTGGANPISYSRIRSIRPEYLLAEMTRPTEAIEGAKHADRMD